MSSWAARSLLITGGCQPCCFRRQPYSRRAPRGWFVRFLAEKQGITWYESKKTPRILGFRPQTPGKEYGGRRKQQGHKRTWLLQEQREGGRGVSAEASVSLVVSGASRRRGGKRTTAETETDLMAPPKPGLQAALEAGPSPWTARLPAGLPVGGLAVDPWCTVSPKASREDLSFYAMRRTKRPLGTPSERRCTTGL